MRPKEMLSQAPEPVCPAQDHPCPLPLWVARFDPCIFLFSFSLFLSLLFSMLFYQSQKEDSALIGTKYFDFNINRDHEKGQSETRIKGEQRHQMPPRK